MTRNRLLLNLLDAKDACLHLLMDRRSKGRYALHFAISECYDSLSGEGYCPHCLFMADLSVSLDRNGNCPAQHLHQGVR